MRKLLFATVAAIGLAVAVVTIPAHSADLCSNPNLQGTAIVALNSGNELRANGLSVTGFDYSFDSSPMYFRSLHDFDIKCLVSLEFSNGQSRLGILRMTPNHAGGTTVSFKAL